MAPMELETSRHELEQQVLKALCQGDTALKPLSLKIEQGEDGLGEDAWRITLNLPAPSKGVWDVAEVAAVRRAATTRLDELVRDTVMDLPGQALAVVTTDQPGVVVALEEQPDENEVEGPVTEDEGLTS